MATLLQQQLAAIAAKSTQQLDLKAQRTQHSQSLLFDSKDAASQSLETVYRICIEGFQDLCTLDARFLPFADSLFSEQSRNEDRTQMTATENAQLDAVICSFLGLVCGKLLLAPGQKAIEWLVRRFRVHEYNTQDLILSFLPYHTNDIFSTMLSILPKTLPPPFRFLQPYVPTLATPPRQAIVYTAINNPGFLAAINNFAMTATRSGNHSVALLGFWASIVAQSLHGQLDAAQSGRSEIMKHRQEDILLKLLPVLQDALSLRKVPELYLGACMIITILVAKTRLEENVLDTLIESIAQTWDAPTIDDGILCIGVIMTEKSSLRLTSRAAKYILRIPDISTRLQRLSQAHNVEKLYAAISLRTLEGSADDQQTMNNMCIDFFSADTVSASLKQATIKLVIVKATENTSSVPSSVVDAINAYSRLYESEFETVLQAAGTTRSQLESALGSSIEGMPLIERADSPAEDVLMLDTQPALEQGHEKSLQELTDALKSETSFLHCNADKSLDRSAAMFAVLAQSKSALRALQADETFQLPTAVNQTNVLSFLARTWSNQAYTAVTRHAALHLAATSLDRNVETSCDLQALLPYALSALADPARPIRRSAVQLLSHMHKMYHVDSPKGKPATKMPIWGRDSLYDSETPQATWLGTQDAYKVLNAALVPVLEECVIDQHYIERSLSKIMNATETDGSLKSGVRSALYDMLISHALATPSLHVRSTLLSMLSGVGKAGASGRQHILIPAIKSWVSINDASRSGICKAEGVDATLLDKQYIDMLTTKSVDEMACLRELLQGTCSTSSTICALAFNRLRHSWSSIRPQAQQDLAIVLLDMSIEKTDTDLAAVRQAEAKGLLQNATMSTEALSALLASIPDMAQMSEKQPVTKRRRTSKTEGSRSQAINAADLQQMIARLTLVLEIVEANKPERHTDLLKGLFRILSELQNYRIQLGSDLVYLQQMVIGSLLAIVEVLKDSPTAKVDRAVLRTDLIVECVRSTSSTSVHHAALLLISSLASWAPEMVLHSVMPIFTFMSTTILRQSDDYSAHIIDQTVSRVVPPLIKSLRKKNKDLVLGAAELLLSFTTAFEHVPMHRRLRLFSHLVEAMGPDESLAAIMAMLSEKYSTDRRVPRFIADLSGQFPATTQLKAAMGYIDLVVDAIEPKRGVAEAVFAIGDKTPAQIETSIEVLLSALSVILGEGQLPAQVKQGLRTDAATIDKIESMFATLLARALELSHLVAARPQLVPASGRIVVSCLGLLPTPHFVRSSLPLLTKSDDKLGLLVLRSFEKRSSEASIADAETRSAMLEALPAIGKVIVGQHNASLKHSAVNCIDHVVERYGKKDTDAVLAAAQTITSKHALGSQDVELQINALLCLSTMVECLKDDMVAMLPKVLDQALGCLEDSLASPANSRLHDAALSFLGATADHMAWTIPSKALKRSLCLTFEAATISELSAACTETRSVYQRLVCQRLDLKVLINSLSDSFETALSVGLVGCNEFVGVLHNIVQASSRARLLEHASALFAVIQNTFDMRRRLTEADDNMPAAGLDSLEAAKNQVLLNIVMKMNDASFRPHFVKLFDFATQDLPDNGRELRAMSFYSFMATFLESLKSIVTSYSSYILSDAADILTQNTNPELVTVVLSAMTTSFKHDQEDFWQEPSHFSTASDSLLGQLSHSTSKNTTAQTQVIEAITELAAAVMSLEHHTKLNSSLLKMTRSENAHVRLSTVKCEQSLTQRLGEDWLAVLPEMLPFISELQEDDDENVERETLKWIKMMEGILGESLDGMLQ